jgi:hypothetical protein
MNLHRNFFTQRRKDAKNAKGILNNKFNILLFTVVIVLGLTTCLHSIADNQLDGTWIAVSGVRLEFYQGNFSRMPLTGSIETGTYTTGDGSITFNRFGYTPEVQPYVLDFPRLRIGAVYYYHDSPGIPEPVEGLWAMYPDAWGGTVIFSKGKPKRGNPEILEGDYVQPMNAQGIYSISKRNLPDTNILTVTPTHVHGSNLATFVQEQLFVHLLELFDMTFLQPPAFDAADWWFTLDEAGRFFEEAAGRARTLEEETQIVSALRYYFSIHIHTVYDYTLEEDKDLLYDYVYAASGINKLTLRDETIYGTMIYTYLRMKDNFEDDDPGKSDGCTCLFCYCGDDCACPDLTPVDPGTYCLPYCEIDHEHNYPEGV